MNRFKYLRYFSVGRCCFAEKDGNEILQVYANLYPVHATIHKEIVLHKVVSLKF